MQTLKEKFIIHAIESVLGNSDRKQVPRIMDLGCGTAAYVPPMRQKIANFQYVGVEPIKTSYEAAEKNLANVPDTKLHFQLGYDVVPDESEESFDLVFSLSALEHIKQLRRFIALSAKYTKRGGVVMHRYDLGHALTPHSHKERFHVWLGNTMPSILPERKFVRYVGVPEVEDYYRTAGVEPYDVTYHQMPSHKAFEKVARENGAEAVAELFQWEMKHQSLIKTLPVSDLERLFPAVAVWGIKQ